MSNHDFIGEPSADQARLQRIEAQLSEGDRLARLEAQQAAIQATLSERRVAETEAAEAIQRKLEETAKAAADALKSALESANVIEVERVSRVQDRIGSVEEAAKVALASAEKAVTLTREDSIRTEGKQNEFRGALDDQAKRIELAMMPRKEFEQAYTSLQSEARQAREEARSENVHLREELSALRQIVAVGPPEIRQLERGQSRSMGARQTAEDWRATALAVVAVLVSLITAVALIVHG